MNTGSLFPQQGIDWSSREETSLTSINSKARQREDSEDRTAIFRDWLRDHGTPCQDIDLIYYSRENHVIHPVAVLEITRVDDIGVYPPATYFRAILNRMRSRDSQAEVIRYIGKKLGIPVYIVVFWSSLTRIWLWNLTEDRGWKECDQEQYKEWVKSLYKKSGD